MFQACWVFCFCPNIKSGPAACWELCSEYSLWPACQANDLHLHQGVHLFTQCAHCVLQPDVCTKLKLSLSCGPEIQRTASVLMCSLCAEMKHDSKVEKKQTNKLCLLMSPKNPEKIRIQNQKSRRAGVCTSTTSEHKHTDKVILMESN